jgi:adenylylsulfate kinase
MQNSCRTFWLTGLSASGKTTLAFALAELLIARHIPCKVLDGDAVRRHISRDLSFSRNDRRENVRRVAVACRQLNENGILAIAALISPYREDRELARRIVGEHRFIEVHVATPLAVCEARDPKGLYHQARIGTLSSFTGVSDPYEPPLNPDLSFNTATQSLDECIASMAEFPVAQLRYASES